MRSTSRGKIGRLIRGAMVGALALTLMLAGVAGFLLFTLTGNAWLDQLAQIGTDMAFRVEGFESTFDQIGDSFELRVEQAIPEAVRPFFD
ncbi:MULTISPECIES: hypothetical protein [Exiguobacterium]|uniref:hypothetical protein n=1 Tax=Exiguobacterium TaxID=33986 RepID=UPI001BE72FB7|nr:MULTISPECIES: hypothetical protein [Exiguobacterium]MCT4778025.1 hypothetical protein [Exiguobacterium aquaticum]MCT4790211.1 hypothetical protein [Exiguobacterium mexicanum]